MTHHVPLLLEPTSTNTMLQSMAISGTATYHTKYGLNFSGNIPTKYGLHYMVLTYLHWIGSSRPIRGPKGSASHVTSFRSPVTSLALVKPNTVVVSLASHDSSVVPAPWRYHEIWVDVITTSRTESHRSWLLRLVNYSLLWPEFSGWWISFTQMRYQDTQVIWHLYHIHLLQYL